MPACGAERAGGRRTARAIGWIAAAILGMATSTGCGSSAGAANADAASTAPTSASGGSSDAGASEVGEVDAATTPEADGGTAAPSSDASSAKAEAGGDDAAVTHPTTDDAGASVDAGAPTKTVLGKYVVTWYSFQDNTPVNSSLSASGRELHPYVSVAVPFRLLKAFGGALDYGDKLYVEFLAGRKMPNGMVHSGWVEIDDFCGDSGDDSYCFQSVGGTKYPNTDLYIGDFTKSGMDPTACTGPAGSGQELTTVYTGDAGSAWIADYGGAALGSGTCGDEPTAQSQQSGCWDYTPPASSASDCASCTHTSCAGH